MSDWNVDTLKEYFDKLREADHIALQAALASAEKAVQAALVASEKAVLKAENASNDRFRGVNEFRQALSDQTATFIPRAEYDTNHKALQKQVDSLFRLVYMGLGIVVAIQFVLLLLKR